MKIFPVIFIAILFFAFGAFAQTTNTLSDAEIQGRALVQKILEQRPAENFTNVGILKIKHKAGGTNLYLTVATTVKTDKDQVDYAVRSNADDPSIEWLKIIKHAGQPPTYYSSQHPIGMIQSGVYDATLLRGNEAVIPFAGSDFWLCDLGLEFLHWPQQKILKKEVHRSRGCTVLESTNPNPSADSYSRVVSWIDNESSGIVEAFAYDADGKKLKNFYPKDFKKVDGQWQVQTLVMENLMTRSKSWLEFDLKK